MDTASDPTLHLLEAIHDPERFVCVPNMPVFTPHVRHDEEGNVEALVDLEELQRIADTVNAMIEENGRPVRISCGHVKLHQPGEHPPPEHEQPPVWGWAVNAHVGAWGPKGKPGLLFDHYYRADKFADVDNGVLSYPYRSAEYYPETHEITGIALLRRDPELDLGVHTYARATASSRPRSKPKRYADDPDDLLSDDEFVPDPEPKQPAIHQPTGGGSVRRERMGNNVDGSLYDENAWHDGGEDPGLAVEQGTSDLRKAATAEVTGRGRVAGGHGARNERNDRHLERHDTGWHDQPEDDDQDQDARDGQPEQYADEDELLDPPEGAEAEGELEDPPAVTWDEFEGRHYPGGVNPRLRQERQMWEEDYKKTRAEEGVEPDAHSYAADDYDPNDDYPEDDGPQSEAEDIGDALEVFDEYDEWADGVDAGLDGAIDWHDPTLIATGMSPEEEQERFEQESNDFLNGPHFYEGEAAPAAGPGLTYIPGGPQRRRRRWQDEDDQEQYAGEVGSRRGGDYDPKEGDLPREPSRRGRLGTPLEHRTRHQTGSPLTGSVYDSQSTLDERGTSDLHKARMLQGTGNEVDGTGEASEEYMERLLDGEGGRSTVTDYDDQEQYAGEPTGRRRNSPASGSVYDSNAPLGDRGGSDIRKAVFLAPEEPHPDGAVEAADEYEGRVDEDGQEGEAYEYAADDELSDEEFEAQEPLEPVDGDTFSDEELADFAVYGESKKQLDDFYKREAGGIDLGNHAYGRDPLWDLPPGDDIDYPLDANGRRDRDQPAGGDGHRRAIIGGLVPYVLPGVRNRETPHEADAHMGSGWRDMAYPGTPSNRGGADDGRQPRSGQDQEQYAADEDDPPYFGDYDDAEHDAGDFLLQGGEQYETVYDDDMNDVGTIVHYPHGDYDAEPVRIGFQFNHPAGPDGKPLHHAADEDDITDEEAFGEIYDDEDFGDDLVSKEEEVENQLRLDDLRKSPQPARRPAPVRRYAKGDDQKRKDEEKKRAEEQKRKDEERKRQHAAGQRQYADEPGDGEDDLYDGDDYDGDLLPWERGGGDPDGMAQPDVLVEPVDIDPASRLEPPGYFGYAKNDGETPQEPQYEGDEYLGDSEYLSALSHDKLVDDGGQPGGNLTGDPQAGTRNYYGEPDTNSDSHNGQIAAGMLPAGTPTQAAGANRHIPPEYRAGQPYRPHKGDGTEDPFPPATRETRAQYASEAEPDDYDDTFESVDATADRLYGPDDQAMLDRLNDYKAADPEAFGRDLDEWHDEVAGDAAVPYAADDVPDVDDDPVFDAGNFGPDDEPEDAADDFDEPPVDDGVSMDGPPLDDMPDMNLAPRPSGPETQVSRDRTRGRQAESMVAAYPDDGPYFPQLPGGAAGFGEDGKPAGHFQYADEPEDDGPDDEGGRLPLVDDNDMEGRLHGELRDPNRRRELPGGHDPDPVYLEGGMAWGEDGKVYHFAAEDELSDEEFEEQDPLEDEEDLPPERWIDRVTPNASKKNRDMADRNMRAADPRPEHLRPR